MLSQERGSAILNEVKDAMATWQREARKLGLSQRDIDRFGGRFELCHDVKV
ncbi:MAG: hypothetical protein NC114_03485 [Ruminococcus flavefaciens]|nr:hypothetical protein [Ruminococcus flavefaciens]